jgi:hypothetical protein
MEVEAIKTVLYLTLVLAGGVMVGVLTILFVIATATFSAWLVLIISALRSRGPQPMRAMGK